MKTPNPNLAELIDVRSNGTTNPSHEQLSFILDSAQVGISNCSRELRFKYVNKTYAAQQGLAPHDLIGKPIVEVLGEAAFLAFKPFIDEVLTGKHVEQEVEVNYERLGEKRWIHIAYTPEFNDAEVIGWVAVVKDITQRKNAELRLQQSKTLLQNVIDAPNIGLAVYKALRDEKGNVIDFVHEFINEQTRRALGRDFTGLMLTDHGPHGVAQLPGFVEVLQTGVASRYVRKAGNLPDAPWMQFSNARIDDNRIVHTWEDITDRIQAEEKLKQSEAGLRQLADAMPQVVWIADAEGNVHYYNDRVLAFDGVEQQTNGSWNWLPVLHPDDRQPTVDAWKHAVATRSVYAKEHRVKMVNGEFRWHLSRAIPVLNDDGRVLRWYGTATDIDELKRSGELLTRERERLNVALLTGELGVYEYRLDDHSIWWSPETYPVYGVDPRTFKPTTESFRNLIHPADREELWQKTRDCIAERKVFEHEYRVVRSDGTLRWVYNRSHIGFDAGGNVSHITGVAMDITDRKLAEEKLQRSEERYRAFVKQSTEAIWRFELEQPVDITLSVEEQIDRFYRYAYLAECNDAMAGMYGYSSHTDIVGARLGDLMPKENEQNVAYLTAFVESNYRIDDAESEEAHKDGNTVHFLNNLIGIVENGFVTRAWGTQRDITAQKKYEATLRDANIRMQLAQSSTGFWTFEYSPARNEVHMSHEAYRRYGIPTDHPDPLDAWLKNIHPDDRGETMKRVQDCLVSGSTEVEYRYHHPEKGWRWIYGRGGMYGDGDARMMYGVNMDITERKLAESELQRAHQRFLTAETALEGYVYEWDIVNDKVWRSENFNRVLGYAHGEVEASHNGFAGIIHPDDRERVRKSFEDLFDRKPQHYSDEFRVRHRNGHYIWMRDYGYLTWNEKREPLNMTGSIVNIHEQKLFTQELERVVEERTKSLRDSKTMLERLNAELASFAYVASHDLREPIRKVLSFGDYLVKREKEKLSERGVDYLTRMHGAASRMDGMLDDLLAFSRVNTWETKREMLDLNSVVSQARSSLSGKIETSGANVVIGKLPFYYGASFQLRQLFIHLFDNAIKFHKRESKPQVELTTTFIERGSSESPDPSRAFLRITISDNGIGIEPQYHERVFELFQRLHSKDRFNGSGIGLSICRKVVENHLGFIRLESETGQGTVVHVFLPVQDSAAQQ